MVEKYVLKPVEVEAVQLENTDESILTVFEWTHKVDVHTSQVTKESTLGMVRGNGGIDLKGNTHISFGDYVIKTESRKYYVVDPKLFEIALERKSNV